MEIRDLRFFCVTAELEHVTRAAEKLGISQPFLTRIIGQIEKELGVSLFDNIGRKIKLNTYGERFYELSKKALSEFDNVVTEMDKMLDRSEKTISLLTNTEAYSTDIVVGFKKLHPDYTLSIKYAPRDEIIKAISTGSADVGLCTPPIDEAEYNRIKTDIIFKEFGCVLLPPGHPLLKKDKIAIEDLIDEPIVISPKGAGMRNTVDKMLEYYNIEPKIACESPDMGLVKSAVENGLGYAFMGLSMMGKDPDLREKCVPFEAEGAFAYFGISYDKESEWTESIEIFKNFLVEFFSNP